MMTITRIQDGKVFNFLTGELKSMDDQININSLSIDFPGDDDSEDNRFTLNLGSDLTLSFQFKLYTQTTDRSNGDNVLTFAQILNYLKRTMFRKSIGEVLYQVEITTKFETFNAVCEIQDFSLNTSSGIYPEGNFKLLIRRYY